MYNDYRFTCWYPLLSYKKTQTLYVSIIILGTIKCMCLHQESFQVVYGWNQDILRRLCVMISQIKSHRYNCIQFLDFQGMYEFMSTKMIIIVG